MSPLRESQIMQSGVACKYYTHLFQADEFVMYIHIHTTQIGLAMLVTFKIPTYLADVFTKEKILRSSRNNGEK